METQIWKQRKGKFIFKHEVEFERKKGRLYFHKSPFALKDEIKAMKGARWHGFDPDGPGKVWSVEDCQRNKFQMQDLRGENPYAWFDREVVKNDWRKFGNDTDGWFAPMDHQKWMADNILTYHFHIWGADMGTGKTLAALMAMEASGLDNWWWVGPRSTLKSMEYEMRVWGFDRNKVSLLTNYEQLPRIMQTWNPSDPVPNGVIFDEASYLKNADAARTKAAQAIADGIRDAHGMEGYVLLMSGTPAPKTPVDWWSLCEIAYPGFIKEGSPQAFEKRLAFFEEKSSELAGNFLARTGWRDDENKCDVCGRYENDIHDDHLYAPSKNEVAYLYKRMKGLVTIVQKKDCMTLPDKVYREIECEPTPSILRVAKAITSTARNTITGLTLLRELSDGFQYRDIPDGMTTCPACNGSGEVKEWRHPDENCRISCLDNLTPEFISELVDHTVTCSKCEGNKEVQKMVRVARPVPCPKEDALKDLLEENEENGRLLIFAGFTGSIDRVVGICQKEGWDTIRLDGRGWQIQQLTHNMDKPTQTITMNDPLEYWHDTNIRKVAFIAHPQSGSKGLTLCPNRGKPGASMIVFWSNDFKPDSRVQAEERIYRKGMDEARGATIVDLFHLPSDRRVKQVLLENRKLELMSMGSFSEDYE